MFGNLWFLVVVAMTIGCATKAEESAPIPRSEESVPAPTTAAVEVSVKQDHVMYEGEDRDNVLQKLANAIALYEKTPRTDGGMPTFKSLAAHSQGHIIKLTWESRETRRLRVNTYPAQDAMWEVSFVVDEDGKIVDMVAATDEPAPLPTE